MVCVCVCLYVYQLCLLTSVLQEVFSNSFQVIDNDADAGGKLASNAGASPQLGSGGGGDGGGCGNSLGGGGGSVDSHKQRKADDAGLSNKGAAGKKPKSLQVQLPADTRGVPGVKAPKKSVCVCPRAARVCLYLLPHGVITQGVMRERVAFN